TTASGHAIVRRKVRSAYLAKAHCVGICRCPSLRNKRQSSNYKVGAMNTAGTLLIFMTLAACGSSLGFAATVTGNVKGPEGAPLEGVFVQAQNNKTHMTYMVLSDSLGTYRLQNLPSGDYALS